MVDMPCTIHEAITPHDSNTIDAYECIVIVDGGDVVMTDQNDTDVTYAAVPAMTVFEKFHPKLIKATGTTATTIVGWKVR